MSTHFSASIHATKVDREGEATVVFKVPALDLVKVIPLTAMTEKLLLVTVEEDDLGKEVAM